MLGEDRSAALRRRDPIGMIPSLWSFLSSRGVDTRAGSSVGVDEVVSKVASLKAVLLAVKLRLAPSLQAEKRTLEGCKCRMSGLLACWQVDIFWR